MMSLKNKRILITGAAFIGSHLLEELMKRSVGSIRIVNLTDKHASYFKGYRKEIEFYKKDLRDIDQARQSVKGVDVVFHLAADHGGRGYVDLFEANSSANFIIDGAVFLACIREGVEKIFYASSGCVYPNYLQEDPQKKLYLKESLVKTPYDADNMYGWTKLMGELTLQAYHRRYGIKVAIGRLFTVYGERAVENHAVIASIAKAFIRQEPYRVWGDGRQVRNWTYVKDVVEGIIRLTQKVDDARAVNLGTMERIRVADMIELIFQQSGFRPKKIKYVEMPTGPLNRVADNGLARRLIDWHVHYLFSEGLAKTIKWYFKNKNKAIIRRHLEQLLIGRG